MAAMAAIAVGAFIGSWVIGPAISRNVADTSIPTTQERPTFEQMVSRPDPNPYRAATPAFDLSGPPNYGAAAREKARAQLSTGVADADSFEPQRPRYRQPRMPFFFFGRH
jgi:hypothetical protein